MPLVFGTGTARGGWGALAATMLSAVALVTLPGLGRGDAAVPGAGRFASPLERTAVRTPQRPVEVIVRLRASTRPAVGAALVNAFGGEVTHDLHVIRGLGGQMPAAAALELASDPRIESVALNAPVREQGLRTAYPAAVGAPRVWNGGDGGNKEGVTGAGVGVAVIDTGIDGRLPDFRVSRRNTSSRVRISAVVNPDAGTAQDTLGHGTHVAGIIAGDGNNRRLYEGHAGEYVGVAPDARLISVKVSDDRGQATVLDAIYGIQFAVDHATRYGIRVINLSLSSSEPGAAGTDPLNAAVEAAWLQGLVVVAAAGNDGTSPDAVSYAPGNDPYVITVGATDDRGTVTRADDILAPWSSRGVTAEGVAKPDVVAPGAHIVSALAPRSRFAELCPACVTDEHYFRAGGTSMSAAVVSGAVALLLERHPDWTPDQVKAALVASGPRLRVDHAIEDRPGAEASRQSHPLNTLLDPVAGTIDDAAASWRAASWRRLPGGDPLRALWAAASWRCADCLDTGADAADPQAASWRAASWRTSFDK